MGGAEVGVAIGGWEMGGLDGRTGGRDGELAEPDGLGGDETGMDLGDRVEDGRKESALRSRMTSSAD